MRISIFLSFPKPHLKLQEQFIEKLAISFETVALSHALLV